MDTELDEAVPAPAANLPHAPSDVAVRVDAALMESEGGHSEGFGTVTWKTLFCADRTPNTGMVVGIAEFGPHATLEPHRHDPAEIYVCTAGSGTVTIDGVCHALTPGVALYLPPEAEHGTVAGPDGLTFTYIFPRERFSDVVYRFSDASIPA